MTPLPIAPASPQPLLTTEHRTQLTRDGWCVVPSVLGGEQVEALTEALRDFMAGGNGMGESGAASSARRRAGETFALRGALQVPYARDLCRSAVLHDLVRPILGENAHAVRGIVFDKTPAANWKVPWHQDLTIAVSARHETPGFGPWSEKAGVTHVQPPTSVLANMLTTRLHLDDCDARNGPLRVLSGSHLGAEHRANKWSATEISAWRERQPEIEVHVPRGGALLMRPLLLHASSPSLEPQLPRRVLHIEWANEELPDRLEWFERV